MQNKNQFPMSIFIIHENLDPIVHTSSKMYDNSYNIIIDKSNFKACVYTLKNELSLNKSFLLEHSAVDLAEYSDILQEVEFFFKKINFFCFYIFNLLKLKVFFNFIILVNTKIKSIDNIYFNANWLERECSEMYNICYESKKDSRRLLLDYTSNLNPMKKQFSFENEFDCYFNIFDNQVIFEKIDLIEL